MTTSAAPHLVEALSRVAERRPFTRKLIVASTFGGGRELLRRLALEGKGWLGLEVTTPRPLASRLARDELARLNLRILDPFDQQALLDEALDAAMVAEDGGLGELSEGVGFRERVHEGITALRLAGIGPKQLDATRLADWSKKLFLLRILQRYERLLVERRRADTATVFEHALAALEAEGNRMPSTLGVEEVWLVPGLTTRGLGGRLLSALQARGAKVLETDPVVGLEVPDSILWNRRVEGSGTSFLYAPEEREEGLTVAVDLFRAASITDELREVLRRVIEGGWSWDQVEIVTPDPAAYGSALHALSRQLEIPATYAVGLPIERTRPGRVVQAYLDWIEEGFQAHIIRRLLEAGDLRPQRSKHYHAPADLSRRFRRLRIGWGRKRYRSQLRAALDSVDGLRKRKWESDEGFERRRERTRGELRALRSILFPTLKATPAVPDRMGEGGRPISPAELARGLRAFLRRVPKGDGADRAAREALARVLERVEATLRRRTDFRAAVTILRRHLQLRVRAPQPEGDPGDPGAPWASEGGHIHLSDLEHGGYTGRPAVFVVGADADRLPGMVTQDPVLLDSDRRVLGEGLPTSSELLRERLFSFAALFARLRDSHVTLSYSAWNAIDARSVSPSSVLLQAQRLARGRPLLTFHDLHEELGRVVCRAPRSGPLLDADDVWLEALSGEGVMLEGIGPVRSAYPRLDAGLTTKEARERGVPGPTHGVIEPRPDRLDPRRDPSLVVSASRLEDLGACPLRYLHKAVLKLHPPDDPELDPERWLDPLRRGGLLHEVFEKTLRGAREKKVKLEDAAFEALALEELAEGVARLEKDVPVPGEGARRREIAAMEEDVRSFVRMVRQRSAPWVALEMKFGLGDDDAVAFPLPGGEIRLRGAVDRVDENLEGVHVVDYKTGTPRDFEEGTGAFLGGRRLQIALYAHAAEQRLGGNVVAGEYHFPTRRGENQAFVFPRAQLQGIASMLDHLLEIVATGGFVPTEQSGDCRFCDYAPVCRVRLGTYGKVESPLAAWSEEHFNAGVWPAFGHLKRVRNFEE